MILCKHFPFNFIKEFSSRDIDYQLNPKRFSAFIALEPILQNFPEAIASRNDLGMDRSLLCSVIREQYASTKMSLKQEVHVNRLAHNNCFTIVTAHQPSLFTGPLYFIYKIISAIALAAKAERKYPEFHFVPVFIIGGEDHDFEEINHVKIFNNTLVWKNDEGGAVGRMATSSLTEVISELRIILGDSEQATELMSMIDFSYNASETYIEFMQSFVNQLLGELGVIVLNMDHAAFKSKFIPVMEKELQENVSHPLVLKNQEKMEALGYKPQAHAREINLFYLLQNARERIVYEDEKYKILNTDLSFTSEELIAHLNKHPARFSPNVILRPLYQEMILPNLVYIGGGGELAYWMERKTQFKAFGIHFPMLYRRDSVIWINNRQEKLMKEYTIELQALLRQSEDELVNNFIKSNTAVELDFSKEESLLSQAYELLIEKAKDVDPTLAKAIKAEEVKHNKAFHQLAGRLIRNLKHKQENEINRIRKLKQDLFPDHGLQERTDNFIPYYLKYGKKYFELLLSVLDPENKSVKVIIEDSDH